MYPLALDRGLRFSVLSTGYVSASVVQTCDPVTYEPIFEEPTGGIEFAFIPGGTRPVESDWVHGEWAGFGGSFYARVLIGPESDIPLGVGDYVVWSRYTKPPQKIIQAIGPVIIE